MFANFWTPHCVSFPQSDLLCIVRKFRRSAIRPEEALPMYEALQRYLKDGTRQGVLFFNHTPNLHEARAAVPKLVIHFKMADGSRGVCATHVEEIHYGFGRGALAWMGHFLPYKRVPHLVMKFDSGVHGPQADAPLVVPLKKGETREQAFERWVADFSKEAGLASPILSLGAIDLIFPGDATLRNTPLQISLQDDPRHDS